MPDTISIYDTKVSPFFLSFFLRGPNIHSSDSSAHDGRGQWRSAVCPSVFRTSGGQVHVERGRFSRPRETSFASKAVERAEGFEKERGEERGKGCQTAARVVEIVWG